VHTLMLLEKLDRASTALAWGALLHDVGKPSTFRVADRIRFDGHVEAGVELAHRILERLRFSREDAEQVERLVDNHMKFKDVPQMRESTLKRFLRLPKFEEHLELHRLDCLSSHRHLDSYQFVQHFLDETPPEQVRPERVLTGDDFLAMGFQPGPEFARILRGVEDAQLEGQLNTKEQATEYVLRNFKRKQKKDELS